MPEAPVIQLLPKSEGRPAPLPSVPFTQARIDRYERWRTNTRWGDLKASTLTAVLNDAAIGNIADWIDLCEFAIGTDALLASLYDTRISRVAQADFIIAPNTIGNPRAASLAAEFVNEQLSRIEDLHQSLRDLLHAIAVGVAVCENEWEHDEQTHTNYVRRLHFRHSHRFRYDESWQLRLWDSGRRRGEGSTYGEALDPRLFTIHQYRLFASYPGIGGIMRMCAYPWVFGRWVGKMWVGGVEKHGSPLVYAKVQPNTPSNVRTQILEDLENLSSDHVGVIELPNELIVEAAAAAAGSHEAYRDYMTYRDAEITKAWLGASDIVDPGKHGSQSAVDTRASITTDPRMVTDGEALAASLQRTLFKQLIALNPGKFGCPVEQVPIPSMKLKTADDEVHRDPTDLAAEQQAARQGYTQDVGRGMEGGKQPPLQLLPEQKTHAMSYGDLLQIVKASSAGEIDKHAAFEMICAGGVEHDRAMRMVGLAQGAIKASTADPKALAPAQSPGQTTRTRQTSSRSRSPFATVLRNGSGGSVFSSLKASPKPRKS